MYIDRTQLKEALWKTALSLNLPVVSLKLKPDQFFNQDLLQSLSDSAAKLNMTIEIDPDLTAAVKSAKAARMCLIRRDRVIRDGSTLLIPESDLGDFIKAVEQAQEELQAIFSQFDPSRMVAVRDGLIERVQSSIEVALADSKSHNKTKKEIQEMAESAANLFANQSFPDFSTFTMVELNYELPTPAVQPLPENLTPEAVESIRKKQRGEIARLWEILVKQYKDVEGLVAVGGLHELVEGFEFLDSTIVIKIRENLQVVKSNRERRKAGEATLPLPHGDVPVLFGLKMAKILKKSSQNIISYVQGMSDSLEDLMKVESAVRLQHDQIVSNLALIPEMLEIWEKTKDLPKTKEIDGLEIEDGDDDEELELSGVDPVVVPQIDDEDEETRVLVEPVPVAVTPVTLTNAFDDEDEEEDDGDEDGVSPEAILLEMQSTVAPVPVSTVSKARPKGKRPVARKRSNLE